MDWVIIIATLGLGFYWHDNHSRIKPISNYTKPRSKFWLKTRPINLNEEQSSLFSKLENSHEHFFITGKAGSGKSTFLNYFKNITSKKVIVVAPTGVAALTVGGQTIHSLFKINPSSFDDSSWLDEQTIILLKRIDSLIIDEVSMVRADLMDKIDEVLRQVRASQDSFGGVQVIMFGDLYQLPPIIESSELGRYLKDKYRGSFFFNAKVWRQTKLSTYELTHVYRQKDQRLIEILNAIRVGKISRKQLSQINKRADVKPTEDNLVTLAATNQAVSKINNQRLNNLKGSQRVYTASTSDKDTSSYPAEAELSLKSGAQVMLVNNDQLRRWVNGSFGVVESLSNDHVQVRLGSNTYKVEPYTWHKIRYSYNEITGKINEQSAASYRQLPLRLAWAITIHKSQGQTYERCIIDLSSGAFAPGQTYVALSRCTSMEGIYLTRPIKLRDIKVAPAVNYFLKQHSNLRA